MAPTDLFQMEAAMKVIFEDSIYENYVTDSELMDQFEQDGDIKMEETTGGRYIETAQYFNLPAGVRSVATNDYIPVPNGPNVQNARIYLKKIQGVVEMTGDTMRRVRTNEGAFLNWAERALPDLVLRLVNTVDRIAIGYGAGALCRVVGTIDAGPPITVIVDSAFGLAGLSPIHTLFLEGEQIVFGPNIDGTGLRGAPTHAVVNNVVDNGDGTATLTLSANVAGVADNDYVFLGDDTQQAIEEAATGRPRDFMGLFGHVDDGNIVNVYQNIDRDDFRLWRGVMVDAASHWNPNILDEDLLTDADDQCFVEGAGKPDLVVMNRGASRQYWRHLRDDRRINDPTSYTGGPGDGPFIDYGDRRVRLRVSRKMPSQTAFGLQTNTFKKWSLGRWEWDDTPGSIWNRVTDGTGRKDAFYAVGHLYQELGCFAPAKNWRINNIDPTADITAS